MKITFKFKQNNRIFDDNIIVDNSIADKENHIKKIISEFNEVEMSRYGKDVDLREFVEIVEIVPETNLHNWFKVNPVTIKDRTGYYDKYECTYCKKKFKRYGFSSLPNELCKKNNGR
jgi:hypothetical protein